MQTSNLQRGSRSSAKNTQTQARSEMTPTLSEMFRRLLNAEDQTRAARSVEYFGWLDMVLGSIILIAPYWTAWLLQLPALTVQGANYLRLVGLLVGGLGMLYVVAGRLSAQGFVFASLLDRPLVPAIMAVLWYKEILPGPLAIAFSVSDFGGFVWTLLAWREDAGLGTDPGHPRLVARLAAAYFTFVSGVVRNARTFHPDGRVFRGTVRSLQPVDASFARAAEQLAGSTLMRIGMGVMKKGAPLWLADRIPDAPSIATRFSSSPAGQISLEGRTDDSLDLLCTAGGNRLWKLIVNLALGGRMYGLHQFDYFKNVYYADVPYRINNGKRDVWIRLVPDMETPGLPQDGPAREDGLSKAVARRALLRIEVQVVGDAREPFVPIAEIRFEEEIQIDQEALHFDPIAGRGFEPHGILTEVRKSVYPASVRSRPASAPERVLGDQEGIGKRLAVYLDEGTPATSTGRWRGWFKFICLSGAALLVLFAIYMAVRLTRDRPVEYADDVLHFEYGSTGGERTNGIPYWFWVALPELFPEYLPDKQSGRGYSAFGMIYEPGKDPRYDLPVGMSMRNFRGIDVVYLNCASCHTGTVRD